ncbi:MAG: hypothetical protein KDA80_21565, partial [Planctomycetaceae bacterium]|nr:hypothetical protein [Planctomycetaceae bacterium]
ARERPRREGAFGPSVEPPPKTTEVLPSKDNLPAGNRQRFTAVTEPVPTNLDPFGGFADTTPPPPRTRAEPAVMPRPEENPFAFGNSASPTPRTREEVAALPLPPVEPTPVEPVSVDPAEPSFVVNRDPGGEVLPELGQPSPIGGIDDSKRLAAAPPEVLPEHPELIENRLPEPTPARTRSSPQTFPNPFAVNDEPAEVLPSHRLQDSAVRNTLAESPNSVEIVMPAGFEDGLPPPTTSSESPQSPEESDEILPSLASDTALSNPTVVEPDDTVLPQPLPGSGETIPADPSTNPFAFGTPTPTDSPTSRNDEEVLPTPVERNPIPVVETAPTQAKVIEITPRTRPEGSRQPERPTGLPPSPYAPTRLDSPQTEVPTGQLATSPASPDSGNAMPTAAATASPVQELLGDGVVDPSAPSGPQTPELQIEKIAPPQAVIGEPLVYSIIVRNVGGSDAREVTVEDRIPRGARLEGTIPQAILAGQKLIWNLGTLEPTEERRIQLKVVPIEPGDIGSVAKVSFAAAVSASIRVTAPDLKMTMDSPLEALVGERIAVHFNIANHGEGEARSVILRALLPDGLTHPGGNDIEYEVGSLAPGAQKSVDLILTANAVGKRTPLALISNDGKRHAELRRDIQIIETRLQVERSGPERRFVGRSGNYTTKVANLSSKRLTNIEIQETIPNGVSLTEQPTRGEWNPGNRTVTRRIPVLEPGETQEFVSQLLAEAPGAHVGTIVAHDDSGNQARVETVLDAKGFSALDIDLAAKEPVIAVGDQISFRLKLRNDGSAEAADVRTRFEIPSGFEIVNASGPVNWQSEGNAIQFASLQKLDANGEQEFDIVLVATEEGTKKVTVKLESADYEQPVITEEPVRVISDSP